MLIDTHVVSVAALTLAARDARLTTNRCTGITAGAVVARLARHSFDFTFHAIPSTAGMSLQQWGDMLIADEPLLIGYRLHRTSRLLRQAGFDRSMVHSFIPEGRAELVDCPRTGRTPLSVSALLNGVMAVDNDVLIHASLPIAPTTGATLALINAAASWVIWFRRATAHAEHRWLRDEGLAQFRAQVRATGNVALIAAIDPTVQ